MFSTRKSFICVTFLVAITSLESCSDEKLKILPGFGWDALTNNDTKQLMALDYYDCKTTTDKKFRIPHKTVAVPLVIQETNIDAEIFEHWSDYTALSSAGLKVATDVWPKQFLPLYNTFSDDYQQMKNLQVKNETFTCRSQIRRAIHRINLTSDAPMYTAAKARFQEVITAVEKSDIRLAKYLTEMIVNDYGTHYTKSVDVGMVFAVEHYLKIAFLNKHANNQSKILSATKLSLLEYTTGTSLALEDQHDRLDSSLLSEYKEATLKKEIRFSSGLNWEDEDAISDCLVAVDKSGEELTGLVTSFHFPKVAVERLNTVRQMFRDVIRDYYTRNIHRGCTRPNMTNFDYVANLDDDSCKPVVSDYVFGGAYSLYKLLQPGQPNTHDEHNVKNPLTGNLSCPTKFKSQVFFSQHHYYGAGYHFGSLVSCMALANDSVGPSYLFGGLYSKHVDNIHTKNKSCPDFYTSLRLPKFLDEFTFCFSSTDNNLAKQYALPFGGFATVDKDFQCPSSYKRHLAAPAAISVLASGHDEINYGKAYYCLQEQNVLNMGVVPSVIRFP